MYELVALGRQPHTGFFGRLHPKDHLIIKEALDAVGIAHKACLLYTSQVNRSKSEDLQNVKSSTVAFEERAAVRMRYLFINTFCRSSDLLLFTCLPTLLYIQAVA